MVWDSEEKYYLNAALPDVFMRDNFTINLVLEALFDFDPQKIGKSGFALELRKLSSHAGVKKALDKSLTTPMGMTLRRFYYDKPFDRANSPKLIDALNDLMQETVKRFESSHGLTYINHSLKVSFAKEATPKRVWDKDDTFMEQEHARFNQLTIDAYRGDEISRYELYHQFLQYPELLKDFLPTVQNVTLDDIDALLSNMHFYPDYRDKVISKILQLQYYHSMLPAPADQQLGTGLLAPQIGAPPPSDSQEMPVFDHPAFILACTARQTVMISWSKLFGEMYLHLDGQTSGPFLNEQDSFDTGRMSINRIEYTWQGRTYNIGNYSCGRPPEPPPPPQPEPEEEQPKKRRRYGPSSSAQ